MAITGTSTATLRTKTGCLTCRARRKKCPEQKPWCETCVRSKRVCSWPAEDDLFDRRHRRVSQSPRPSSGSPEPVLQNGSRAVESVAAGDVPPFFICREIATNTDLFNSATFKSDLEFDCFRHYLDWFLPLVILSNSHPVYHSNFVPEQVEMVMQFDGCKNVALACGASHLHLVTGNAQLNEAGIEYYSRAVSEVNRALSKIDWDNDEFNDALLTTIIFLYIHGMFVAGTSKDVPKHVTGAIQLMKLRCTRSRKPPAARPIHRIMWESILYQVFRQTVNHPFSVGFQPDYEFCARAERILQSLIVPDASPEDNSPVIGFPLSLQKFIIEIVQLGKSRVIPEPHALENLAKEMEYWESTILEAGHCLKEQDSDHQRWTPSERALVFHQHSTSLHILAASLLLHWVTRSRGVPYDTKFRLPPTSNAWQVRRALEILQCPQANEDWSRCYLGSWPTLIFGYAVETPKDVALIRRDLENRFRRTCSGEELRLLEELESVWQRRGILPTG